MNIRRIEIPPGAFADTDWMDPAVEPPTSSRPFRILSDQMRFAFRGRASAAPDADVVSLGAMTVDSYVAIDQDGGGRARGKTLVESEGAELAAQIVIASSGLPVGSTARLHLTLTAVSAPLVEVRLLSGGRLL